MFFLDIFRAYHNMTLKDGFGDISENDIIRARRPDQGSEGPIRSEDEEGRCGKDTRGVCPEKEGKKTT